MWKRDDSLLSGRKHEDVRFHKLLRMEHSLKRMTCLFLEFSIGYFLGNWKDGKQNVQVRGNCCIQGSGRNKAGIGVHLFRVEIRGSGAGCLR